MKHPMAKELTIKLLDKDLANSTWRDNNEEAYKELLKYRQDIEQSFRNLISAEVNAFARRMTR